MKVALRNTGVMWSYFRVPVMNRAAAFCSYTRTSADVAGVPRWHRTVDCCSSQANLLQTPVPTSWQHLLSFRIVCSFLSWKKQERHIAATWSCMVSWLSRWTPRLNYTPIHISFKKQHPYHHTTSQTQIATNQAVALWCHASDRGLTEPGILELSSEHGTMRSKPKRLSQSHDCAYTILRRSSFASSGQYICDCVTW